MRIHNLYEDDTGVSHFRDIEAAWAGERPFDNFSTREPACRAIFRETSQDYTVGWHPAPRRQYAIDRDAEAHIAAGDGETRRIGRGEIVPVEDTTGRGHISRFVGGAMRRSIFVALD